MTTVRELLISFGATMDKGSLKKVDNQVNTTASSIRGTLEKGLGAAFIYGLGKGTLALTKLASDAEEVTNLLNVTFGESAEQITRWSEEFSKATGQSRYEMQEVAGELGSLLKPMLDDNTEAALAMSTSLGELAYNLGSIKNREIKDVLVDFQSALAGSPETMRKYGVNMLDASLSAFALEKGIRKSFKTMSIAEKTQLRYEFILAKTTDAQGDAVNTANQYANATKGMWGALRDLGTVIGMKVLPFMTYLVRGARWLARTFEEWTKNSNIAEAALLVLGATGVAVAAKLLYSSRMLLLPWLKLAAIFAIVVLIVDDFLTFLEGGDSVIGRFIDSIWGPGSAAEAAKMLKQAWEDLGYFWEHMVKPAIKSLQDSFESFFAAIMPTIEEFYNAFVESFDYIGNVIIPAVEKALNSFFDTIKEIYDFLVADFEAAIAKVAGWLSSAGKFLGFSGEATNENKTTIEHKQVPPPPGQFKLAPAGMPAEAGGAPAINQTVNVDARGATSATAAAIADKTADKTAAVNRRTLAALKQRKRSS